MAIPRAGVRLRATRSRYFVREYRPLGEGDRIGMDVNALTKDTGMIFVAAAWKVAGAVALCHHLWYDGIGD